LSRKIPPYKKSAKSVVKRAPEGQRVFPKAARVYFGFANFGATKAHSFEGRLSLPAAL
jgi:hypothetical protein